VRLVRVLTSAAVVAALAATPRAVLALDPTRSPLQYRHDQWGPDEGLTQVTDILQGTDGFVWLGTASGLHRWDGVSFLRIPLGGTEDDTVRVLHEDAQGRLWAGREAGLASLTSGGVQTYGERDGLPAGSVFALASTPDGSLWVGTLAGVYVGRKGRFTPDASCADLATLRVWDLARTRDGAVWVATRGGGVRRIQDGRCSTYGVEHGLANPVVLALHEDASGTLWVGTQGGLSRWDGTRFHTHQAPGGADMIRSLTSDRDGNLWIGTSTTGLRRLHDGVFDSFTERDGLGGTRVFSLHEDREGSLWLGTRAGLERLQDSAFVPLLTADGVFRGAVRTLLPTKRGGAWIGTESQGLLRIEGSRLEAFTSRHGLPDDTAAPLLETPDGRVFVGTTRGLYVLQGGRFTRLSGTAGLGEYNVRAAVQDGSGVVWIGTDGGLFAWDGKVFTPHLPHDTVLALHVDGAGALWIGTSPGGLKRIVDGRVSAYTTKDGLSSNTVTGFREVDGALWMTTGRGLTRLRGDRFTPFTAGDGVLAQRLFHVFDDTRGFLWVTSGHGVFRIRRDALESAGPAGAAAVPYTHYSTADGLPSAACSGSTQPSGWQAPDGTLWVPTRKGIGIVDPGRTERPALRMPIRVDSLVADGRRLALADRLELPAGLSSLEVQWVGLSLRVPSRNVFKYRLEGYDPDWVNVGNRRFARFGPLPPGDYRFRVIGASSDGTWNHEGATVSFTVRPFFHQTAWFKRLIAVAILLAVVALHRLRLRRLHERYAVLLTERSRMARELHDTLDQGIAAAGMQIQVAEAKLVESPDQAALCLQHARRFLDDTLEEGRRSVWALRSLALADEGGLPSAFARLARELSSGTRTALRVDVDGAPRRLAAPVEEHVLRIGQEAITNALRHGSAHHVVVTLAFEPHQVVLRVRDDGRGFDVAAPTSGVGLRGMRERAVEMGAALEVRSRPGSGTETTLEVPAR
jgi:signal transduction histidine kinase/ligand-binding sensor domain-containing protein